MLGQGLLTLTKIVKRTSIILKEDQLVRWACWYPLFSSYSKQWSNKENLFVKCNCVVCVCCIIFNFETSWKMFSQKGEVCNRFEKHVVEGDGLFTNHLVAMGLSDAPA